MIWGLVSFPRTHDVRSRFLIALDDKRIRSITALVCWIIRPANVPRAIFYIDLRLCERRWETHSVCFNDATDGWHSIVRCMVEHSRTQKAICIYTPDGEAIEKPSFISVVTNIMEVHGVFFELMHYKQLLIIWSLASNNHSYFLPHMMLMSNDSEHVSIYQTHLNESYHVLSQPLLFSNRWLKNVRLGHCVSIKHSFNL
jgi:hypothetical protein